MKKVLILGLLLPIFCLVWQWSSIPAQVPFHFSRNGADVVGSKWELAPLAVLPLLLYSVLPLLRPASPREPFYQQAGVGFSLLGSLALCAWFIFLATAG